MMASALTKSNIISIISKSVRSIPTNKSAGRIFFRSLHRTAVQNGIKSKWVAPTLRELKKRVDLMKEKGTYPTPIRSTFLEWNYDSELFAFGKRLNEEFNSDLLREAFVDDSYIFQEMKRLKDHGLEDHTLDLKSNRDLDAAGRNLIEDFGTKYLRGVFPLLPEEGVESLVRHLASDEVLGGIARELGFRDLILIKEYPPSVQTYARCFSAVVACLNVSSGIERCQLFILDFVITQLVGKDLWDIWEIDDPRRLLRNILIRSGRGEPEPRLLGDLGRNTIECVFYVGIYDGNKRLVGKGYGEKPDIAVEVATYDTLSQLFSQSVAREPLFFEKTDLSQILKTEPNLSISSWKIDHIKET